MRENANRPTGQTDWRSVDWKQANRSVRNLRRRIFRATQEGDHKKVRSLQKLILRSQSNLYLSIRRVTQVNRGKNTPGVDQVVIKTPEARGELVDQLRDYQPWRAKPTRRVYIPKANGKQRPLGIPVVADRVMQARVKNALEPEWEARFEAKSYGFRPGRSAHDAIQAIFNIASKRKRQWVVDADIKGAFDNIDHAYLIQAIGTVPGKELIRQWLKAGYMEDGIEHDTPAGTPQGGVISPLLANIALHGMEVALGIQRNNRGANLGGRAMVRYADDFVVLCDSREEAEGAIESLKGWLAQRGLTLSEEKTRIVHLTEGFDFLGFNIQLYKVPESPTGFRLWIKPSKDSLKRLREKIRQKFRNLKGAQPLKVVTELAPVIRGWAGYFRIGVSYKAFSALDKWMLMRFYRWMRYRHPNKPYGWIKAKYLGRFNLKRMDFTTFGDKATGAYLPKFAWTGIQRHVPVRADASPDDPKLQRYWQERSTRFTSNTQKWEQLAKAQNGICPVCGDFLLNEESLQLHHMLLEREDPRRKMTKYQRLVHLYCHQQIHGKKGNLPQAVELLIL